MTPFRLSIFSKIILWFFLNLLVLSAVFVIFFQIRFHVSPDSVLAGSTSHKTISLYRMLRRDISVTPRDQWDSLLERYADGFDAELTLISLDGRRIAGSKAPVPGEVISRLRAWHRQFSCPPHRLERKSGHGPHGFRRILRVRTTDPVRYYLGIPLPLPGNEYHAAHGSFRPAMLLIGTDSLTGSGFFPDIMPVLGGALVIIIISLIWWFPMVRHITRPLERMTRVTEEIANGHFGMRVDEQRRDEIGRLGRSINLMSERLENFISGQKRFLSDVAHELCSPLARMKMGLGILENRAEPGSRDYIRDVSEEADNIAELVNEILSFSRAEFSPEKVTVSAVDIEKVVSRVLEREKTRGIQVKTSIPHGLFAMCNEDLLARALANLLRNAVRYAGKDGPVRITAGRSGDNVYIEVSDSGPGVPSEYLNRIFDPFFRVDVHRNREAGGAGLGLSIVRTCVEACRGSVSAENMEEGGLRVRIELQGALKA